MESIDERIQKALSSEDQAFLARMNADGSFFRDVAETFRGHMRWLNALAWVFAIALFAVAVFCSWKFATRTDSRNMQLWGAGTIVAILSLGLIKLWFWMELQKVAIVREIKRVEFQVASLTAALRAGKAG